MRGVGSLIAGPANRAREALRALAARIGRRGEFSPPADVISKTVTMLPVGAFRHQWLPLVHQVLMLRGDMRMQ